MSKSVRKNGFSLVESLLVVVLIGFIILLMSNLPSAIGLIRKSNSLSLAREIAAKQIEDKRAISYVNLVNDNTPIVDSRINSLPAGSGTVTVEDCDSAICTNSELVKMVTVTVNWRENNKDQSLTLKTFIAEGGLNQ